MNKHRVLIVVALLLFIGTGLDPRAVSAACDPTGQPSCEMSFTEYARWSAIQDATAARLSISAAYARWSAIQDALSARAALSVAYSRWSAIEEGYSARAASEATHARWSAIEDSYYARYGSLRDQTLADFANYARWNSIQTILEHQAQVLSGK